MPYVDYLNPDGPEAECIISEANRNRDLYTHHRAEVIRLVAAMLKMGFSPRRCSTESGLSHKKVCSVRRATSGYE